ncbi:MAG TPA: aromatic amino acid lyase [Steroidobacteraceae bacterium]|nr:aromatic amino acid lyase [Steroidobacteraceae bacterium]
MTVILDTRWDISLEATYRVAWRGENVRISDAAMQRITASRTSFLNLIENDPTAVIYGVTTSMGELASQRLTPEERDRHARLKPFPAATAFGDELPERVVRAIVLARLTNFIEGHAATTPRIAKAVAHMLDGGPMPRVAAAGQGGAGEILALYPLFAQLSTAFDLQVKERGSLINGSPCGAALIADSALAARRRLKLALKSFALSIEAFRAPLEHYDAALEVLWGDTHEAAVLRALRSLLVGAGEGRRHYQAPVSYRIVPRVLGHAHRAVAAAEHAATVSLASISDNPVYLPPDANHPHGRCISTGGYHNSMAAPALDDLAAVWADLCLLCERHSTKLLNGRASQLPDLLLVGRQPGESDGRGHIGYVPMAAAGYIELAKAAAQRTFLHGSDAGAGQDDVASPVFHAWSKQERAGRLLDASLAMLAVVASQALHVTERPVPPALRDFTTLVRSHVPPLIEDRILGPELGRLAEAFTAEVFAVDEKTETVCA